MPVRSLTSSVLKWPDSHSVQAALEKWAADVIRSRPDVVRAGYFGSYARGDWGVGSDLDLIVVVRESAQAFATRVLEFDTGALPVPVDMLVYTEDEWQRFSAQSQSGRRLSQEVKWVYPT
jgi:uncharacterized protein